MKEVKFIPRHVPEKIGSRTSEGYYKKKKQLKKEDYFLIDICGRNLATDKCLVV